MNRSPRRAVTRVTVLIGVLAFISGCGVLRPGFEAPSVNVQSFESVPSRSASGLPSFEIGLRITNPNSSPLRLAGVRYSVSLDGEEVIQGVGNDLPVVEAYGEATFTVTAAINLLNSVQLLRRALTGGDGNFDYEFKATLDPGGLQPKIRVRDSGTVSLNDVN